MYIVLPTPGGSGLYLAPNIIGWIFISILISFGLWQLLSTKQFIFNSTLIYTLGAIFLIIPVYYSSPFVTHAIPRLLGLLGRLLFFIALLQLQFSDKQKQQLLWVLLIGISVEALIGLCQLYILTPFNLQVLGYTPIITAQITDDLTARLFSPM